jgi:hypothetical protein
LIGGVNTETTKEFTKYDLKSIKGAVLEIASLQRQLNKINNTYSPQCVTDSVKGSSAHFPYIERIYPVEGIARNGLEKVKLTMEAQLSISIASLQAQLKDAYKLIDAQEDADTRTVLRLKYINGLTWPEIAKEANMSESKAKRCHKKWQEG